MIHHCSAISKSQDCSRALWARCAVFPPPLSGNSFWWAKGGG